jgi:hypothetical protein
MVILVTSASATANRRQRGSIRPHRSDYQVRVAAGTDPATGERIVLTETSHTLKEAERARSRLLAEADAMKTARTETSFGRLLELWFSQREVGVSAHATYDSLIRNHIRPALGAVPLTKLQRSAAEWPLTASGVRQIHAVISGALSAAFRWGWLPFNPAETARIPAKPRSQPRPPSSIEAAGIVEEAWRQNDEWGLYIWLAFGHRPIELNMSRRSEHSG